MGANYAEAAIAQYATLLDAKPLLALVRMALVVPDGKPEPTYWGGWETLAFALGANLPWDEYRTPEAERPGRSAKRSAERVTSKALCAGAITGVPRVAAARLPLSVARKAACAAFISGVAVTNRFFTLLPLMPVVGVPIAKRVIVPEWQQSVNTVTLTPSGIVFKISARSSSMTNCPRSKSSGQSASSSPVESPPASTPSRSASWWP